MYRLLLAAASVLALTACITQNQVNQSGTVAAAGQSGVPVTRVVRVVPSPQGSVMVHNVSKSMAAGDTISVAGGALINADCSVRKQPILKIIQAPAHGTAQQSSHSEFGRFAPTNPNYACNKVKIPGTYIMYTPNDGFTGTDFIIVDTFLDGVEIDERVSITVK
jgi:hypothetical protein